MAEWGWLSNYGLLQVLVLGNEIIHTGAGGQDREILPFL